jgi:quercetin dioxygenase-like cupin family protein
MKRLVLRAAAALTLSVGAMPIASAESASSQQGIPTAVIAREAARTDEGSWGRIWVYAEGETHGSRKLFAGRIELKPGAEIHPPHEHVEEEFLLVISGEGSWVVENKSMPAKAGDLLYARPGDLHGISAAPGSPLTFFIWKWESIQPRSGEGK